MKTLYNCLSFYLTSFTKLTYIRNTIFITLVLLSSLASSQAQKISEIEIDKFTSGGKWYSYSLTYQQMIELKVFPTGIKDPTFEIWYDWLNRFKKKEVKRTGVQDNSGDTFYADKEYDI